MDTFFKAIEPYSKLSTEGKRQLKSILKRQERPKGYLLVKHDTVCNNIFFVEKGLTRTYYYKNGRDVTDWFSPENTFACSILSYLSRNPDRRGIELLEDSCLITLQYYEIERLCLQHHDIENFVRQIISDGLIRMQNRFDSLIFETAEQRYKNFNSAFPFLHQRINLGHIASFLGITQETLSRIRAAK